MSVPRIQRPFKQIDNTDVYVSYPQSKDVDTTGKAPRVILLFGWMEASLQQLYRFTEMYHELYPSATQILVRVYRKSLFVELPTNASTNDPTFARPIFENEQKLYVLPVVKLLHDAGINAYDSPATSGLLVHSISNGGALAQTYLAHCLADARSAPSPNTPSLPAQAIIYDSLPSTVGFKVFLDFFSTGISSPALRLIAKTLLLPAYVGTAVYRNTIDRRPDNFTTLRAELSDAKLMPQRAPQVYIYGDADLLTPAESVEKFTDGMKERLRKEGVDPDKVVRVEKFVQSAHVSHAKNDSKRYWDAVVRTWEASYRDNGKLRCKL
ncbi:hypothetical protein FRC10_012075 [Ceratobasidium sp. 414]|nr:hypothetical protein FRC10_012075 [Ceratobasidium sp. 414]